MSDFVDPFDQERPEEMKVVPEPKIIKTVEDVPAELERVTGEVYDWDRTKIDREWLERRAGKRK